VFAAAAALAKPMLKTTPNSADVAPQLQLISAPVI
jgi:hypothetical protein